MRRITGLFELAMIISLLCILVPPAFAVTSTSLWDINRLLMSHTGKDLSANDLALFLTDSGFEAYPSDKDGWVLLREDDGWIRIHIGEGAGLGSIYLGDGGLAPKKLETGQLPHLKQVIRNDEITENVKLTPEKKSSQWFEELSTFLDSQCLAYLSHGFQSIFDDV